MISFNLRLLYLDWESPIYPQNSSLSGPRAGLDTVMRNVTVSAKNRTRSSTRRRPLYWQICPFSSSYIMFSCRVRIVLCINYWIIFTFIPNLLCDSSWRVTTIGWERKDDHVSWSTKDREGIGHGYFKIYWYSPGGNNENHENRQWRNLFSVRFSNRLCTVRCHT